MERKLYNIGNVCISRSGYNDGRLQTIQEGKIDTFRTFNVLRGFFFQGGSLQQDFKEGSRFQDSLHAHENKYVNKNFHKN